MTNDSNVIGKVRNHLDIRFPKYTIDKTIGTC